MTSVGTIHAGCVLVGEAGILIRGAPGCGKSTLACDLLAEAGRAGIFTRLVADDRVSLSRHAGRLVARPAAAIAGLIEMRGLGLRRLPHESAAVVRFVVDCQADWPRRYPDLASGRAEIGGIELPRVAIKVTGRAAGLVMMALNGDDTIMSR